MDSSSAGELRASIIALYERVSRIGARGDGDRDPASGRRAMIAVRLRDSVLRPLRAALARLAVPVADDSSDEARAMMLDVSLEDEIWALARQSTALRVQPGAPPELMEVTAALQDLVARSGREDVAVRLAALRAAMADVEPHVRVAPDGPYLISNMENVASWLGEVVPSYPQMALCRCGASSLKPYCDGSHVVAGFSGAKDPKRVVDRLDIYLGQEVTVHDNRGICAHSGFCTDRLSSAFHAGSEPFVTPSGARLDELIGAVRSCPSGALSYAIDGEGVRDRVDRDREPRIEVSKDGPYRVTGRLPLVDEEGHDAARAEGSSREHYSLCRCGHSQNKPFCSGMHWYVKFADPVPDPERDPTLFEWAGGYPALLRMTRLFYGKYVPQDPLIGPLFASMSPDHPERVAAWLSEVFGGPKFYSERYGGYNRMISQHINKGLTEAQRARWASLMGQSAGDAGLPNDAEFRAAFSAYIEWGSRLAVENSQSGAKPPPNMPMPRWWWVCNATPGSRVSALASVEIDDTAAAKVPAAGEAISFERHIKGLFRKVDRDSMKFVFDLWSYGDVRQHASAISERLRAGTMPCDGPWPPERCDVFERWVATGCGP